MQVWRAGVWTPEVTESFLKADLRVDCGDTASYGPVLLLSWVAIALYPVGVPVLYWVLLRTAKHAIRESRPTPFSRALDFLHRDFEPQFFWWELVEIGKKLLLVGFATIFYPDTMYQLLAAFMISLIHRTPFRDSNPGLADYRSLLLTASTPILEQCFSRPSPSPSAPLATTISRSAATSLSPRFSSSASFSRCHPHTRSELRQISF